MEVFITLVVSIVVGAGIGGLTNFIAIQMLFRPYQQKKIWKWSLPFTPGLIPKRQAQMAVQLGKLVEEHLFTLESLRHKLKESSFQKEMIHWAEEECLNWLKSGRTLNQLLEPFLKKNKEEFVPSERVEREILYYIEQELDVLWGQMANKRFDEFLPLTGLRMEDIVVRLTETILENAHRFLHSEEGYVFLQQSIQRGMEGQGPLGNMVGLLLTKERVVEKGRSLIIDWLERSSTKDQLQVQLSLLIKQLGERHLYQIIDQDLQEKLFETVNMLIQDKLTLNKWFELPLDKLSAPWQGQIQAVIHQAVPLLGEWLYEQSPSIFQQLGVSEMVKEQVMAFPLPRLERMVRYLANNELKMITWLGAVVGGVIGSIQAVIILLTFT